MSLWSKAASIRMYTKKIQLSLIVENVADVCAFVSIIMQWNRSDKLKKILNS